MGEPRKTNSHSPLEILPGLYTAILKEGQPQPRKLQGLFVRCTSMGLHSHLQSLR
jgi:hypothetical protein